MLPVTTTLLPGFAGTTLPGWLSARLRAGLAGVCLFGPNIASPSQLRDLTRAIRAANPRAIVAVDEEGGDVTRLFARSGSPYPGNAVLGRLDDLAATRAVAVQVGRELRRAGCTVDLAPSVDINTRADNPVIGVRSFGATPALVGSHGAAWIEGLQSSGVAATAKHFPGHGDTAQDSHVALPAVDRSPDELRQRELVPFVAAVAAGVSLVMTSHVMLPQVDPANPATMSPAIVTGLLREELGFTGVVVSDALDMAGAWSAGGMPAAAVRALNAGCDLLCLGTESSDRGLTEIEDAVRAAVTAGRLGAGRVEDAAGRVLGLGGEWVASAAELAAPSAPPTATPTETPSARAERRGGGRGADHRSRPDRDVRPPAAGTGLAVAADRPVRGRPAGVGSQPGRRQHAVGPVRRGGGRPGRATQCPVRRPRTGRRDAGRLALCSRTGPDPVLVLGRDIHRHPFARAVVDRLRAERAQVLVVDMGWPSGDRGYADVATFGASRLMGRALLAYLAGPGH